MNPNILLIKPVIWFSKKEKKKNSDRFPIIIDMALEKGKDFRSSQGVMDPPMWVLAMVVTWELG